MAEWPGAVSRREFVRGATKVGAAAGAATVVVWTAPQLSSVALAQDAPSSGPPPTTVSPITVVPNPVPGNQRSRPGTRRRASAGTGAGDPGAPSGTLPFTGINAQETAKLGAATAALGWALVGLSKLRHPFRRPPDGSPPSLGSGLES